MAKRNSRLAAKPVPEEIEATVRGRYWPEPGAAIHGTLTRAADGRLRFEPLDPGHDGQWVPVKEAARVMGIGLFNVYKLIAAGVLASKRRCRNKGMKVHLGSIQDWLRAQ